MADSTDFQWIYNNVVKRPDFNQEEWQKKGNIIAYYIPPQYEAYCKILHPFTIDLDKPETLWNEKEVEEKMTKAFEFNTKNKILRHFNISDTSLLSVDNDSFSHYLTRFLTKKHNLSEEDLQKPTEKLPKTVQKDLKYCIDIMMGSDFKKLLNHEKPISNREWEDVKHKQAVTWKEIAGKYGLVYHNQLSRLSFEKKFEKIGFPINLWFPNTELQEEQIAILKKFIKEISAEDEVFWQNDNYEPQKTTFERMLQSFQSPNRRICGGFVFDKSRKWLLWMDEHQDQNISLFAGTKEMIEKLKKTGLEIIECTPETRIDWMCDSINKE